MFKHLMKNISTKNITLNIKKMDGYDKTAIGCWGICIATSTYWMYAFVEHDGVLDKIWRDDALKKNDDYF